jgi:hypothetical protein
VSERVLHIPEAIAEDFLAAALGRAMTGILLDKRGRDPLSYIVNRAREAAIESLPRYIEADLTTAAGIDSARQAQAELQRYLIMVAWITEATEAGDRAQDRVMQVGDPVLTDGLVEFISGTENESDDN